jgi:hypothetical protein
MASSASFLAAAALAACLETDGAFSGTCLGDNSSIEEKEKKADNNKNTIEYFFITRCYSRGQQNKPFRLAETTAGPSQSATVFSTGLLARGESLTI